MSADACSMCGREETETDWTHGAPPRGHQLGLATDEERGARCTHEVSGHCCSKELTRVCRLDAGTWAKCWAGHVTRL
jgi:hypothetical protein